MKDGKKTKEKIRDLLERQRKAIMAQIERVKSNDPFFAPDRVTSNEAGEDASEIEGHDRAQALRQECAASGVRVSIINPGMVRTGFFDRLGVGPGKEKGNFLLPEEIAEAVVMVLSRRHGVVFDEINMTPLKKAVRFRSQRNVESDTMGD